MENEENFIGRYVKALVDNPYLCNLKRGEVAKITDKKGYGYEINNSTYAIPLYFTVLPTEFMLLPLEAARKEKTFEIGKWYKSDYPNGNPYYLKVKDFDFDKNPKGEAILENKKYSSGHFWNNTDTIRQALETGPIDVSEIQEWLLDGHPDKIVKPVLFDYPEKIIALQDCFRAGRVIASVKKGDIGTFARREGVNATYNFPNFKGYYVIELNFTSGKVKEYREEEEKVFIFPKNVIALKDNFAAGFGVSKGDIGELSSCNSVHAHYNFPNFPCYGVTKKHFEEKGVAEYYVAPGVDGAKYIAASDCTTSSSPVYIAKIGTAVDNSEDKLKFLPELKSDLIFLKNKSEDDRILI